VDEFCLELKKILARKERDEDKRRRERELERQETDALIERLRAVQQERERLGRPLMKRKRLVDLLLDRRIHNLVNQSARPTLNRTIVPSRDHLTRTILSVRARLINNIRLRKENRLK
jgi:hypothetical protein